MSDYTAYCSDGKGHLKICTCRVVNKTCVTTVLPEPLDPVTECNRLLKENQRLAEELRQLRTERA